jgi:hypothetical protein
MKKSQVSKDKKSVERKKAVDFAMSMRGQMLIGKALHYGMIKIMEVEKEKQYFQSWVKELEDLRFQSEIDKKEIFAARDIKQRKKDEKRIKELEKLTQNYKTSDVEDLEYIAENLYAPWIEMCKFTEQFDEGDLSELLKKDD